VRVVEQDHPVPGPGVPPRRQGHEGHLLQPDVDGARGAEGPQAQHRRAEDEGPPGVPGDGEPQARVEGREPRRREDQREPPLPEEVPPEDGDPPPRPARQPVGERLGRPRGLRVLRQLHALLPGAPQPRPRRQVHHLDRLRQTQPRRHPPEMLRVLRHLHEEEPVPAGPEALVVRDCREGELLPLLPHDLRHVAEVVLVPLQHLRPGGRSGGSGPRPRGPPGGPPSPPGPSPRILTWSISIPSSVGRARISSIRSLIRIEMTDPIACTPACPACARSTTSYGRPGGATSSSSSAMPSLTSPLPPSSLLATIAARIASGPGGPQLRARGGGVAMARGRAGGVGGNHRRLPSAGGGARTEATMQLAQAFPAIGPGSRRPDIPRGAGIGTHQTRVAWAARSPATSAHHHRTGATILPQTLKIGVYRKTSPVVRAMRRKMAWESQRGARTSRTRSRTLRCRCGKREPECADGDRSRHCDGPSSGVSPSAPAPLPGIVRPGPPPVPTDSPGFSPAAGVDVRS